VDATLEFSGPNYDQPPTIDPEDIKWEVERLVSKCRIGRVIGYKMKWRGYPASENTWEKRDIHHEIVAALRLVKLPRERGSCVKSEAYPYGNDLAVVQNQKCTAHASVVPFTHRGKSSMHK
jgi:chromodomain-containing protein